MGTKNKMIRFLVEGKMAKELEKESQKLNISVSAFLRLLIKQWDDGIKFEKK